MRFVWNSLQVGDAVRIHHKGGSLEPGSVAFVDALPGSNGIGIRVASADDGHEVVWPSRMTVHSEHGDTSQGHTPCLRCADAGDDR